MIKFLTVAVALILLATPQALAQSYDQPTPSRDDRYTYLAHIVRVIDGDTVEADIDLGFHTWRRGERLRLARIDAPEPKGVTREQGLASSKWLRDRIEGKWLIVRTKADRSGQDSKGSFGRYLVELFLDGSNLNDDLVASGMAVYRQ